MNRTSFPLAAAMLVAAVAMSPVGITAVAAQEQKVIPVGDWQLTVVRDWPPDNRPVCMALHRSKEVSVFVAVEKTGATHFGLRAPSVKLTPAMFLDGSANLWFDGTPAVIVDAWSIERLEATVVNGRRDADGRDPIMPLLAKASRITVRAPGFEASVSPAQTERAVRLTEVCAQMLPDVESTPTASSDGGGTNNEAASREDELEALGDQAEAQAMLDHERAAGGGGGSNNEAERLGQALQGMAGQSPTLAQFRCSINGDEYFGVMSQRGRDDTSIMTLTVAEDGSGEINGGRFQPAYVDTGATANGRGPASVAYRLRDVIAATQASPEHAAPPLLNMSDSEMAAYRAAMGLMQGAGAMLLGDRQRYITVSLADDVVRFLDLTPQNQAVNIATLECVRTK